MILAGLGKFTLWGAVLVDVGPALLVILHGMLLMRWRVLEAISLAESSTQTQAGTCSLTASVQRNEQLPANSTTGKPSCCRSSSKQCSVQMAVQQDRDYNSKNVDGKNDCYGSNKQCSGKLLSSRLRVVTVAAARSSAIARWLLMRMRMVLQRALLANVVAAVAKLELPPTIPLASLLLRTAVTTNAVAHSSKGHRLEYPHAIASNAATKPAWLFS